MSWYSEFKDEWKEIIETVAREERRSTLMVEKDTIQSMFLFRIANSKLPFVFKGGTSLSKCYDAIARFSEDIDLSMNHNPSESKRRESKEIILEIGNELGLIIDNLDEIKSRYDYNKYIFKYDSLFADGLQEIIVETNYYQSSYPVEEINVNSIIGRFCEERDIVLPITF